MKEPTMNATPLESTLDELLNQTHKAFGLEEGHDLYVGKVSVRAARAELSALRERAAMVKIMQEREQYFAKLLNVTDGGQYRADWPAAIERLRERASAAEAEAVKVRHERNGAEARAERAEASLAELDHLWAGALIATLDMKQIQAVTEYVNKQREGGAPKAPMPAELDRLRKRAERAEARCAEMEGVLNKRHAAIPKGLPDTKPGPCFWCGEDDLDTGSLADACLHGDGSECLYAIECDRCGARGPAAFAHQDPAGAWNAVRERFAALRARVAELEGADAHIAEAQQLLAERNVPCGADGSLIPGINGLLDRIAEVEAMLRASLHHGGETTLATYGDGYAIFRSCGETIFLSDSGHSLPVLTDEARSTLMGRTT